MGEIRGDSEVREDAWQLAAEAADRAVAGGGEEHMVEHTAFAVAVDLPIAPWESVGIAVWQDKGL